MKNYLSEIGSSSKKVICPKNLYNLFVLINLFIFSVNQSSFSQSRSEKKVWQQTLQLNSVSSYKSYLKDYPNGAFSKIAIDSLYKRIIEIADKTNSIKDFEKMICGFPSPNLYDSLKVKLNKMCSIENKNKTDIIDGYKNNTALSEFWKDGWDFDDPEYGIIGVVAASGCGVDRTIYLGVSNVNKDLLIQRAGCDFVYGLGMSGSGFTKQAYEMCADMKLGNASKYYFKLIFKEGKLIEIEKL